MRIDSGFATVAGIFGAMLLGQLYAATFHQEMTRQLKIKIIAIAFAVQLVFAVLYMILLIPQAGYGLFAAGATFAGLLYVLGSYWMLSLGGKTYLKAMLKKQNKKP